ncbi:MAG: LacI family transcriptional regulator [Cyclobacteriaceae bacterium]|jgi:LacI family transcriptional regulator
MVKKNYTIKDIAKLAGLSRGTVDKVIHNRSGVSQENIDNVKKIIKEVNYQPNLLARSLKKHKPFTIAVIIPEYEEDAYWRKCHSGILTAEKEFKEYGGRLLHFIYKRSEESYRNAFLQAIESSIDAILIAPIYFKGSDDLYGHLDEKRIPYNFINSRIPGANYKSFVGQDYHQSGKVAARLMELISKGEGHFLVIGEAESFESDSHLRRKEEGFRSYFKHKKRSIVNHTLNHDFEVLERLYKELKPVGIFVTTSRASQLVKLLKPNDDVTVIGYDLIDENVDMLKDHKIDVLIYQNPVEQGYRGINKLIDFLLNQKEPESESLLPIDIVTSENLGYYI